MSRFVSGVLLSLQCSQAHRQLLTQLLKSSFHASGHFLLPSDNMSTFIKINCNLGGFFFFILFYDTQHWILLYLKTLNATVSCQPTGCNAPAVTEEQLKELFIY